MEIIKKNTKFIQKVRLRILSKKIENLFRPNLMSLILLKRSLKKRKISGKRFLRLLGKKMMS